MTSVHHLYVRPDLPLVFIWHGGAYIEIFENVDVVNGYLTMSDADAAAFDCINVWDYSEDRPTIHLEQVSAYDTDDFEAACVDWLVAHNILPFWCRVDDLDLEVV